MTEAVEKTLFTIDGDTLFLLGNGPSLKQIDLRALSPFSTLGMNAAYRRWREIDWRPRYYACLDLVVGLSHKDAIAELVNETGKGAIQRFLLRDNLINALGPVAHTPRVLNFDALRFAFPILRPDPVTTGSHAALWAAAAGFRKIVLLGIDGKYVERVEGAKAKGGTELEIVEEKHNPNYFFDGYQRIGDRYNIPNPRPGLHIAAWEIAASLLSDAGVTVVNANPDSEIRFFPWVSEKALIEKRVGRINHANCKSSSFEAAELLAPEKLSGGVRRRLRRLLVRQGKLLAIVTGLTGVASTLSFALLGGDALAAILTAFGLFYLLSIVVLGLRDALSEHLGRLDQRMLTVESAMSDFYRRYGHTASSFTDDGGSQLPWPQGMP